MNPVVVPSIYDHSQKVKGKGLDIFRYGYEEAVETALLIYDFKNLNKDDLDFRGMALKHVSNKISITETGDSIQWYEEDLKEVKLEVTTVTSDTEIIVDSDNVQVGETIFASERDDTAVVVVGVTGNTLMLASPWLPNVVAGDTIIRGGFSKKYGVDHGLKVNRNDMYHYTNYIQFAEHQIDNDLIENNRTRLFMDTNDQKNKLIYGDASRKIIKDVATSLFTGRKAKVNNGGSYHFQAGGLMDFIPAGAIQNIKGVDNEETKKNLRDELTKAYKSGLTGIWGRNKLLAFCTTKFMDEIDYLYESKMTYNDVLKAVNVNITSYKVGGKDLNMVASSILDHNFGDRALCFLVPVDYVFMYMLPNGVVDKNGKTSTMFGKGIVYQKPQQTFEKTTIALASNFSWMFGNMTSGAYRRLEIA